MPLRRKLNKRQLAAIAIILDEEEEQQNKKTRTCWVDDSLKYRKTEGEYVSVIRRIEDNEVRFYRYFKMTSHQFHLLLEKIEPFIRGKPNNFRECISAKEKLCLCLRFLTTGDSFTTIAFSYCMGISTVRQAVLQVCNAIINSLLEEMIPTPSKEMWEKNIGDFWEKWNFPNCVGAVDGKHVVIVAPPNSGSLFFNYKKTFSIVLLALVDANYNFIAVNIGAYGKDSDGGILLKSKLGQAFLKNKLNIPEKQNLPNTNISAPCVILGDEGFPLKPNLLRPYPSNQSINDEKKRHFNYRLSRARRVVENAFGILGQKFRLYNRRLHLKPEYAEKVVLSTCILYNFIRLGEDVSNTKEIPTTGFSNLRHQGGNAVSRAFEVRNEFANYFQTDEGKISWEGN